MASLFQVKTGWQTGYRLQYRTSGRRHSMWLGNVRDSEARRVLLHVSAIEEAIKLKTPIPSETLRWLADHAQYRQSLAPLLGTSKTVDEAADLYYLHVQANHKETTARAAEDTIGQFASHFGNQPLRSITGETIDGWLARQNVAASTVGKHVKILRTWLRWSLAQHLIDTVPQISTPSTIGVGEKAYVDFDGQYQQLIDYFAGDREMQCILAMARWNGPRVASEVVTLRRSNVDLANDRFLIDDSKRSHRQSRGPPKIRTLPLFSSLRPYVMAMLAQPGKPTDYLLPTIGGQNAQRAGSLLRQRVYRALDKLGIPRWPRVFHSPRATRQTQLKESVGEKAACDWIGNTPDVSRRNYELIDGETFARAVDA